MTTRIVRISVLSACFVLAACATKNPEGEGETIQKPPGIEAVPARVAFLCVTPGCEKTETVNINVIGSRRVAIKRILLEGDTAGDFSFTPSEPPPFIVGENSSFTVDVKYVPKGSPAPGAVELRITYTDASADESEERIAPGELAVPLVRRLVGEPVLAVAPEALSFGFVAPGTTSEKLLKVENQGFGNIALELSSLESQNPAITAALPAQKALGPGASTETAVTFAPTGEAYVSTKLVVSATAKEVVPVSVRVEGTSLTVPKIGLEPGTTIDFGELQRTKQRVLTAQLVNQGGVDLTVQSLSVMDGSGNLSVSAPMDPPFVISPLQRLPLTILVDGKNAGFVDALVSIASDDPATPTLDLHVAGTITEPQLTLNPTSIDWGTVPVGWVVSKPVELKNTGYGTMTVKNITLVSGSSNLFTLQNLPSLPLTLKRDARTAIDVEFRAETSASFNGWLSIETDDPQNPFVEIPLKAVVGSCDAACPITNGTPSCSNGTCSVGMCDSGWYDTDKSAATGCECKEVGTDPGQFCADSVYKGTLSDNDKDQTSHSGILPIDGDIDVIRFWAEDKFAVFDENFKVKIRLDSADPSIRMCIYRSDGAHQTDCFWSNEVCPATRTYQKNGSGGSGDDADFIVKVYRDTNVAPTCATYTVFMSNGI